MKLALLILLLSACSLTAQTLNVGTANVGTLVKQEPPAPDTSIVWVSTNWLWFGTNLTGATNDLSVTVSNSGTGTLTGSASTASPFSVIGASSYAITGTDTTNITVRYTRSGAANDTNELALTGGGATNVHLSGVSTNAPGGACDTARDTQAGALTDTYYAADPVLGFASSFTAGATATICKGTFELWIGSGTLNGTLKLAIYADNAGLPGALVDESDTVNASTITGTTAETANTITFSSGLSASLTSGTTYRVAILRSSGATGELGVNWVTNASFDSDVNNDGSWENYQTGQRIKFALYSE